MSKKLRGKKTKNAILPVVPETPSPAADNYPAFNFRYLTANKNYNFCSFSRTEKNKKGQLAVALIDRLECLSQYTWMDLGLLDKFNGYETIEFSRIDFHPTSLSIQPDEKVYIFRFNGNDARLIGYRDKQHPYVIFIIGYDFNFSAYNHGS